VNDYQMQKEYVQEILIMKALTFYQLLRMFSLYFKSSDVRVPLSHANNIKDKYIAAIANDMSKKDWIGIYDITRMLAGLKNEK
jgi:hypothetical protein